MAENMEGVTPEEKKNVSGATVEELDSGDS